MFNFRQKTPARDIELSEWLMPELKADVVVLGAGMVGLGAALHLQKRGRDVMLVDRHNAAGEETSYGNAGLIECASVFPYMFPRDFGSLDRKSTRLNSSHSSISYAVFCLKKKRYIVDVKGGLAFDSYVS